MPICFIADCHVGNPKKFGGPLIAGKNERCQKILNCLKLAADEANKLGAPMVIAGDLFDTAKPSPQLIKAVQDILASVPEVYCLVGNHDMISSVPDDHAMAPLAPVARIIEKPEVLNISNYEVWAVPFQTGYAEDWLPGILEELGGLRGSGSPASPRVLVIHLGISDEKTDKFLQKSQDQISAKSLVRLAKKYGITHIYAGNWHKAQKWVEDGVEIQQIGALCPTGFANPGADGYGGFAVLDEPTRHVELPGPRFFRVNSVAEATKIAGQGKCKDVYVSLTVSSSEQEEAKAFVAQYGESVHIDLKTDKNELARAAKTVAAQTTKASSINAAIEAYVDNSLVDGLLVDDLIASIKKYL